MIVPRIHTGSIVLEAQLLAKGKPPPPPMPCPGCGEPTEILIAVGRDPFTAPDRCLDCRS